MFICEYTLLLSIIFILDLMLFVMFWKLLILLLFSNTLRVANGLKDFGNVAPEKHLRFQKRSTFTYFWNKKFSKDQLFLERLLNELENQIEATQERNKEREEEIKRNIKIQL